MADLARLIVSLEAQTSQFQSQLEKANSKLDRFEKRATTAAGNVRKAINNTLGGIAAGIGIAGTVKILDAAIDKADQLGEMVQQTGLAADQLQALGNIAAKSGSDLDSVASAIAKFNKNISEGAGSSAEKLNDQALAFQALGISVEDLKSKNTAQLLEQAAKKLSTFRDDANKAAIEMALFGKSGAELTPTLNALGRDGLEPTIQHLSDMGVLIGEDAIKAADQFNDRMVDAKAIIGGFAVQLSQALLPTLTALIGEFGTGKTEGDKLKTAAEGVARAFQGILVVAIALKSAVATVARALGAAAGVSANLSEGMTVADFATPVTLLTKFGKNAIKNAQQIKAGLSGSFEDMTDAVASDMETMANVINAGGQKIDKELKKVAEVGKDKDKAPNIEAAKQAQAAAAEAAKRATAEAKKAAADRVREQQQAIESMEKLTAGIELQVATFGKSEAEILEHRIRVGDLVETIEKGGPAAESFAQGALKAQQALDGLVRAREVAEGLKQVNVQLMELSGDSVGSALARFDVQNAELAKKLTEAGNKAGLDKLAQLRAAVGAQEQFNQLLTEAGIIQTNLGIAEERIRNSRESGAISEFESLTQLGEARSNSVLQLEQIRQKMQAIADASGNPALIQSVRQFGAEIDSLRAQTDLLGQKFQGIFQTGFTDAVASVLDGTKSIKDAFRSMVADIASQLAKLASQQIAQSLFSSIFGGGGFGSTGNAAGDALIASVSGRAAGGPVNPGTGYVVGERGPEFFVPNTAGRIVPNEKMGGESGAGVRILNVIDPGMVNDYLSSPSGEKAIVNLIRRNAGAVRSVVA